MGDGRRRSWQLIKLAPGLLVAGGCLWLALRDVDRTMVVARLSSANWALAPLMALLLLVFWPGALRWSLEFVGRLLGIGRLAIPLSQAYEGARRLLSTRAFIRGLCLALVAWFAECLAFQIVLLGFDQDIGTVASTFIYAFATIFGALTFIPGGLGTTEGSMAALLGVHGVGLELSVAATFVIRVCTLWFAVLIGGVVLLRSGFTTTAGDASESTPTT